MSQLTLTPGVIEGQTLTGEMKVSCDVCIVGSGAGGSMAAATLQKAGMKVLVLEEGGYFTKSRFRMQEEDTYSNLYQDGGQRVTKDLSVSIYQGRAVGGGTVVNWTTCFRLPDQVIQHWKTEHGVKSIEDKDLTPHYESVEQRLGIAKVPLEQINRNNRILYDGCKKLGYHVDTLNRNVQGCARTGYCGMGCPIDAKQSMLVTYLPDAMDHGATVLSRCRVETLSFEADNVKELKASLLTADGRRTTGASLVVKAKKFILSAGAINTPGILLRSGAPDPNRMIGKRTFLHPVVATIGIYEEPVHAYYGAPQGAASHHFAHRGQDVGYFLEAVPTHPLLASTAMPGFGDSHRSYMEQLPHVAGHIALAIDGFHGDVPGGSVVLSPGGKPILDYTVAPKVWSAFREAHKSMARIHLTMGAKEILTGHEERVTLSSESDLSKLDQLPYEPHQVFSASAHQMGGSMMSDDPHRGVVRASDLRHHTVKNLHVLDGSVFPTSLGVNPQLSIYGLCARTATLLADAWS
jgi:choline dehydrogenase-like flavoprotein